jgi:hypothetical protein
MAAPNVKGGVVEYFAPGDRWTATVDEVNGVVGGEVVALTGNRTVKTCTATDRPVGVAMHDAADDATVTVISEGIVPLKAAGAIAAGDIVVAAAAGAVAADNTAPDAQFIVGVALEAIADTAVGRVKLRV